MNFYTSKYEKLRIELDKAIQHFVDFTPIEELIGHCKWYNVDNIFDLKETMYESYLDTCNSVKELKEKINLLYE